MSHAPRAEIQALVDAHTEAFNTQNTELFLSVFGNTAVVIDGNAPYRWLNPNPSANWLADVENGRRDLGVTYDRLSPRNGIQECRGLVSLCRQSGVSV